MVFHTDLDQTLIYSCRHDIGPSKRCVERYQGREVSFMTDRSHGLLEELSGKVLVVPTTTRTREQYERIDLGIGNPEYALVCNGGVLLRRGEEDEDWYRESLALISPARADLGTAARYLERDPFRNFELRDIRELFLFTKSSRPLETAAGLRELVDPSLVEVFCNGTKVYAVPRALDKGTAVRRFRDYLDAGPVLAAGDSAFDLPMLRAADLAFAPEKLLADAAGREGAWAAGQNPAGTAGRGRIVPIPSGRLFSDEVLEYIARIAP